MQIYNPYYESSHKELFFMKDGLRYVFAWELEVLTTVGKKSYSVESWGTLPKLGVLLKICPFSLDIM